MNEKLILVVDDEQDICVEISGFLSAKGYQVITAYNGQDGVKLYKQSKPVLVLSDYKMPIMTGIDLLRAIKAINKDTHVVLISGAADARTIVEAMKEDAFDFLLKPIDLNNLLDIVKTAISRAKTKVSQDYKNSMSSGDIPKVNESDNDITVFYFSKDLDEDTSIKYDGHVKKLVTENATKKNIVFYMNNITYINNMGLNFLIEINKFIKERGYTLYLCNLSGKVDHYLRTLGYIDFFNITQSLEIIKQKLSTEE